MSNTNSVPSVPDPAQRLSPLGEVHYSLKKLRLEAEYERQHSALGAELLDQAEIATILACRRKPEEAKQG